MKTSEEEESEIIDYTVFKETEFQMFVNPVLSSCIITSEPSGKVLLDLHIAFALESFGKAKLKGINILPPQFELPLKLTNDVWVDVVTVEDIVNIGHLLVDVSSYDE